MLNDSPLTHTYSAKARRSVSRSQRDRACHSGVSLIGPTRSCLQDPPQTSHLSQNPRKYDPKLIQEFRISDHCIVSALFTLMWFFKTMLYKQAFIFCLVLRRWKLGGIFLFAQCVELNIDRYILKTNNKSVSYVICLDCGNSFSLEEQLSWLAHQWLRTFSID